MRSYPGEEGLESAVFEVVIDGYPAPMSVEEIIWEVAGDPMSFSERDDVNNAIRDLAKAGVLHRAGNFIFPTRAAVRVIQLGI
jgi:hypothetical protein